MMQMLPWVKIKDSAGKTSQPEVVAASEHGSL
jgi:hypothetical protein